MQVYLPVVESEACLSVLMMRSKSAPRLLAWVAWECLSQSGETYFERPAFFAAFLTILSAWSAVIGLAPPSDPFFWERNIGASGSSSAR